MVQAQHTWLNLKKNSTHGNDIKVSAMEETINSTYFSSQQEVAFSSSSQINNFQKTISCIIRILKFEK